MKAQMLIDSSRWADAKRELEMSIAESPEFPPNYFLLSRVLGEQGQWRAADGAVRKAIGLDPESDTGYYLLAGVLLELGDMRGALAAAEAALRIDPDDADNHGMTARVLAEKRDWKGCREAARYGYLQSMREKSGIYSLVLKFNFWAGRFSTGRLLLAFVGLLVVTRMIGSFAEANPAWAVPVAVGKTLLWMAVLVLVISEPLSNLVL